MGILSDTFCSFLTFSGTIDHKELKHPHILEVSLQKPEKGCQNIIVIGSVVSMCLQKTETEKEITRGMEINIVIEIETETETETTGEVEVSFERGSCLDLCFHSCLCQLLYSGHGARWLLYLVNQQYTIEMLGDLNWRSLHKSNAGWLD